MCIRDRISGGLLLLLIGLELLMGKEDTGAEIARTNIALVPLCLLYTSRCV